MKPDREVSRRALLIAAGGLVGAAGAAIGAKGLLEAESLRASPAAGSRGPAVQTVEQLQRAARTAKTGDRIVLVPGTTYTLDRTLTIRGTGIVLDGAGATLRLSDGAQRDTDRVLDVIGSRCTVTDLVIAPRPTRKNASEAAWTVQVLGDGNTVQSCTVDVAAGYAIGIAGGAANVIAENVVTGGGILYGWNDVSGTRCVRNVVKNTDGNAFSGVGNSDSGRSVTGCVVSDNVIQDCGRIAIEDFSNVQGSQILRNRITRSKYMGISAVGARTTVAENVILDGGRDYGIETGASGNVVRSNQIVWTTVGTATGLIVNNRWKFGGGAAYTGFRSADNVIAKALIGVSLNGTLPAVVLDSDSISDCGMRAISAEPTSAKSVRITSATILFSDPAVSGLRIRDGISVSGASPTTIRRSSVTFDAGSGGSTKDYFVRVEAPGTTLQDNVFTAYGRTDADQPVVGSVTGSVEGWVAGSGTRINRG